ncbi:MAG: radical SAM protein [Oscillospiraceae bacterium]|jgi:anaerobic ribonucleoside-triphosphate reductase activating protein|nr:radical SAM protein [Oscillospiraceae bacterium]
MRIAGIVEDSIVDGEGMRFVVFTQGCVRLCPGCHNPQTQNPNGGYEISVDELFERVSRNPLCDGITLSGGEPFAQSAECAELARRVKAIGKNVWCYSGYTLEELQETAGETTRKHKKSIGFVPGQLFIEDDLGDHVAPNEIADLLDAIDVLVDGMFIMEQKSLTLKWRGSANQRILEQYKPKKWRICND